MVVVVSFVVFGERSFLGRFSREYGIGMEVLESLVSGIAPQQCLGFEMCSALFEQAKIMRPADPEGGCDDLVCFVDDELRLQGMALLFP